MKIGSLPDNRLAVANTGPSQTGQRATLARAPGDASAAKAPAAATSSSNASVTVSALAQVVNQASSPEFDSAKVERVRQAIAQGTFKPNPEAIADKLLSNANDMLQRPAP